MSININVNGNSIRKKGKAVKMVPTDSHRELEELNKRRILRMQQVREQSKDIAANVREKVKKAKAKQQDRIEEDSAARLKEWQNRKLLDLQGQYRESLKDIGLGHTQALLKENEELDFVEKRDQHYRDLADSRGTMAKDAQQIERNEESLLAAVPKQLKRIVRDAEDARAAMVCKTKQNTSKKRKKETFEVPGVADDSVVVDNNITKNKKHQKSRKNPHKVKKNKASYDGNKSEIEEINYTNKNHDYGGSSIDSEVEERVIDYNKGNKYESPYQNRHYTSPIDESDYSKRSDWRSRSPRDYHDAAEGKYLKNISDRQSPNDRRRNHKDKCDTDKSHYKHEETSKNHRKCYHKENENNNQSKTNRKPVNETFLPEVEERRYSDKYPKSRKIENAIPNSYLSERDESHRPGMSIYTDDETMRPRQNIRKKVPENKYLSTGKENKQQYSRSSEEITARSPPHPRSYPKSEHRSKTQRSQDVSSVYAIPEKPKKNLAFDERKNGEDTSIVSEDTCLNYLKDTRISDRIKNRKLPDLQHQLSMDQGVAVQQIEISTQTPVDYACQIPDIPEKPTIILKPGNCGKGGTSTVSYYDYKNRYNGECLTNHNVHRIPDDSIEVCATEKSEPDVYEKMKFKRDQDAEQRGKLAMEKVRIQKDYDDLVHKLPVLQKQERLASMNPNKNKLHMTNDRRMSQEKQRQNKMENAFEKLVANTITIPPKTRSKEDGFNPGSWNSDVPEKNSSDVSTEMLKSLLEKLKIQKDMLLQETEPGSSKLQMVTDLESSEISKTKSKLSSVSASTSPIKRHKDLIKSKSAKSPKRRARKGILILQNMSTQTSPLVKMTVSAETSMKEVPSTEQVKTVGCECKDMKIDDNYCEILIKIPDKEKAEVVIKSPSKDSGAIKLKLGDDKKKKQKFSKKKHDVNSAPISKDKTWDEEFSKNYTSSTSYLTPPEFSKIEDSKNFSNSLRNQTQEVNFAQLLHKKPQQSNITNTSSSKSMDPKLLSYIKKLLNMSRGSVDNLSVSSVSEVSTPSSSIINMETNNPRAKLMNVLKFCNIDINELIENLSKSSASTKHESTNNNESQDIRQLSEQCDQGNYPQIIADHYNNMADQYQKRIQEINEKLLQVRAEARKLESPNTSDDKENTTYFNLPKSDDSAKCTSPEQRMLNNQLLTIDLEQLADHILKKSPRVISDDVDKDIADRYLRLLDEKPTTQEVDFVPLLNFDLQNIAKLPDIKHRRPPPTTNHLTVTRLKPELNFKPHELSTIAEGDSLRRSKSPEVRVDVTATDGSQGTLSKADSAITRNLEAIEMMGIQMKIFNNLSGNDGPEKSDGSKQVKSPKTVNFTTCSKTHVINNNSPKTNYNKSPQVEGNEINQFSPQPGPSGFCQSPKVTLVDILKKIQDANSTDSSTELSEVDIEVMLRNMGMGWAASTVKKTKQTLVPESSSSSFDNKEISNDTSLLQGRNMSTSTSKSDNSSISPYLADFQNISAIQGSGLAVEKQLRTSTPMQNSKSTTSSTDT